MPSYLQLFEAIPCGAIRLASCGKIIEANASAKAIIGQNSIGQPWGSVWPHIVARTEDNGITFITHSNKIIMFLTQGLQETEGQIILLQDITDIYEHHRVQKATELVHEIRTPLASLKLYLETIQEGVGDDFAEKYLNKSLEQVQKMENLVNETFSFVKSNQGLMKHVSIREMLGGLIESICASNVNPTLLLECKNDLVWYVNESSIECAVSNLIRNAIAASPPEESIVIKASENEYLTIEVQDKGVGVHEPLSVLVKRGYTTKKEGLGLGLALVEAIAIAHGGKLSLYPNHPKGSIFKISIPHIKEGVSCQIS